MKTTRFILILTVVVSLGILVPGRAAVAQQTAGELFEKALYVEESQGELQKAIGIYQDLLKRFPESREVAAKAQLHIGLCYEKLGTQEAEKAFQKVIANYPEQLTEVRAAKEKLSAILKARPIADAAEKALSVRLLWSGPDADGVGKASPDGLFLSFIEKETANLSIRELASGKTSVVTKKEPWGKSYEFAVSSCWSPDGKKLAYGWFNKDNAIELRTVDTDGSNVRVLYQQKNEMAFPMAWSPDGKFVAASLMRDFYKSYNVGLISVEDGSVKVLKTAKLLKTAPKNITFSADSRYLVIDLPQGEDDPKHDLFAFSVDGQKEIRIAEHPADDSVLDWIPGSDNLLFLSDRTGTQDAWIAEFADGQTPGEPRLVRKDLGQVTPLGLSREGSFFYRLGSEMTDIAVASIDLEKQAFIEPLKILPLPVVGANYQPQWSPDGRYLAYLSNPRSGPGGESKPALWIRSADTGETRKVNTNLQSIARPCWAPDGRSLFVIGNDGKTFLALYQIQIQTGQTTFFVDSEPGANIKFIAPAPDGKSVYYTYFEFAKKRCRIMSIVLSNREIRELYRQEAPPDIGGLRISPDGKSLVFGTIEPDGSWVLEAFPLPGGPPRKIFSTKANASGVSTVPFWAPDGKRLLFFMDVSKGKDKRSELWSVPAEGGEPQSLGLNIDMNPKSASLHPDGRRLAFSISQPSAEVWVMENFLPPVPATPEKGGRELSMRRVYDGTGLEWGNALSSDGRYLVYTDWGSGDLAVMDLVTKKSRPLTNKGGLSTKSPEMGETSAFSPDDKRIAYGWYNKDKVPELWVIGFDGSNPRMLCRDEQSAWIRPHDWSPDGQKVLAINMKKEGASQILLVSAADGTIRVLRDVPAKDPDLDLSPDGRFVACSMAPEPSSSKRDVFIVKTEDGTMSPLIAHAADDYSLGWAPDGKKLFFASDRTGAYGLWGIEVAGRQAKGSPYLVKSSVNKAEPVRLTPNGKLYYVITETIMDIFTAAIDPDSGKVQGQPTAVPARYSGANAIPDWSPDGTRLAYCTNTGGISGPGAPTVISILDIRTGEERQVTPKIGSIRPNDGPRWAPDGRSVLVIGATGEETAIYRVDITSGASNPLVIIPKFQYTLHAVWSADGKSVFYAQGNPTRILRRDLDTGKDTELAAMTGPAGIPVVAASPDGKWLAFTSREEGEQKISLKIVPSEGGEVRELFQSKDKEFVLDLNWTPDGRFLWFRRVARSNDPKMPPQWESWRISPDGGNLQRLELTVPGGGIRLHPNGRQIAFSNGRGRSDLWVMENFLSSEKK